MDKAESILGKKEDIRAILAALGIKNGDKPKPPEPFFSPRKIIEVRVDNGAIKTQEEWIKYFNSKNKVMISMPDLYHAGKSNDTSLLGNLQGDFDDTWEATSTRLIYQPDNLNGRVVHYFGSSVIEPVEIELLVPDYNKGKLVSKVLNDPNGLAFFQAICGTEDDKKMILKTLVKLSGKSEDTIEVWTPDQENRKEDPEMSILCFDDGLFHVGYLDDVGIDGCSCVVQKEGEK